MENQGILITGGTKGLGLALAKTYAENNHRVVVIGRNPVKPGIFPENIHFIKADISDKNDTHRISAEAYSYLKEIDVLINNASTLGPTPLKNLMDTDCEAMEKVLETNVLGPFRLTKAVLPGMLLRKKGIVVNISSDAAVNPYETWGSYSLSKAAADQMLKIWHKELDGKGLKFLSLDPGDMNTDMHRRAYPTADVKTLLDPIEVAKNMYKFLSSAHSSKIVRYDSKEWNGVLK